MKKKLALILAGTQLLLALTACNSTTSDNTNSNTNSNSGTGSTQSTSVNVEAKLEFDIKNMTDAVLETAGLSSDTVIATAGGRELTAGAVLALTVSELDYLYQMSMYGMGDIPWGEVIDGVLYEETALQSALELALIYEMLFEVAEEEGLTVSEDFAPELQAYLDSILEEVGGNPTIYQYVLFQALTTEEEFIKNSEANELYGMIYDKYFGDNGTRLPSEEEQVALLEESGAYRVKHILITAPEGHVLEEGDTSTFTSFDDAMKADTLAYAESLLAQLEGLEGDELGDTFHEMMLEYSEDPGSLAQPDGYTAELGMMVPEFEEASLALAEGELSTCVESSFGYHIIYRLPLVADPAALTTIVDNLAIEMQEEWIAENPIETNELYDQIDLRIFYDNLNVLRTQLNPYIEAGDPDLVIEEEVEDPEEGVPYSEEETTEEATEEESDEEESSEEESDEEETEE